MTPGSTRAAVQRLYLSAVQEEGRVPARQRFTEAIAAHAGVRRLEHIQSLLTEQGYQASNATLTLFSLHGFHPDLLQAAAHRPDVLLIDVDGLYGINSTPG